MRDVLDKILTNAAGILSDLEYIKRPVTGSYKLQKDPDGHYTTPERTYHSGSRIEYLETDSTRHEDREGNPLPFWKVSRVEFSFTQQDYYIVGHSGPLDGITVRERERHF